MAVSFPRQATQCELGYGLVGEGCGDAHLVEQGDSVVVAPKSPAYVLGEQLRYAFDAIVRIAKWTFPPGASADEISQDEHSCFIVTDERGVTNCHEAAFSGDMSTLDMCLRGGVGNLELKADDGRLPIHDAAYGGQTEVIHWMIKHKSDLLHRKSDNGMSVLTFAVANDQQNTAIWLMEDKGVKTRAIDFFFAAKKGHIRMLSLLDHYNPGLIKDNAGPLLNVMVDGSEEGINWLLEKYPLYGKTMSEQNAEGATLLHLAARRGRLDILEEYKRVDPAAFAHRDHFEASALTYAVRGDQPQVIEWLRCNTDLQMVLADIYDAINVNALKAAEYLIEHILGILENPEVMDHVQAHGTPQMQRLFQNALADIIGDDIQIIRAER